MRKLAAAAFSFSAAIFAANYIFSRASALYAALVCAFAGAALLAVRLKSLRGLVIAAFAASIGLFVFAAHYDLTVERAHTLAGETRQMRFVLLETPRNHNGYTSAEAWIELESRPRLKCILYDYDEYMSGLSGGDRILVKAALRAADLRYGEHTDRYNARDVYLTASLKGGAELIGRRVTLSSLASAASDRLAGRIDRIFDNTTASFLKALVLGDKSDLYENDALYVWLSRAGLMHVVAVSGMHVSFLVAFLQVLLGRGKRSALLCIPLVWAFVILSGMSPSAVRAAFMQTMLLSAPLFGRENDALTSLSAALAVLLLVNPFAAANISLQLSFAAMLGIVLFAERIQEILLQPFGEGRASELMRAPVGIVSSSLSVMLFTLPITTAYFGYVSLLSLLTNLLCLWAVPICFFGALAACALSWLPVVGTLIPMLVTWLARGLFFVCRLVSSLSFSVLYLPGWMNALWIALFYLSIILAFAFRLRPRWKLLVPLASALAGILLCRAGLELYYSSAKGTFTAIDVGQGQCVSITSGERAVLIDCGSTSYADYNAGDCAAAYLKSCGIEKIDAVVFTHLHADHANGFERLANLMEIEKVFIPADVDNSDELLPKILLCAYAHEIVVEPVSENKLERFGDIRLLMFSAQEEGGANERCMPIIVSVGGYDAVITGDAPAAKEWELTATADLSQIETIVVGHHGSDTSSCAEYLCAVSGQTAIVSVGHNSYGLPSEEVLERLASFGYTVKRTDEDGNVEIRING